ncbi:hypothetical protein Tco_1070521 [Tanacetum coccineum]|uniref:Glutamic acid-rich protein-like n=1 Tax=Tanacetum coccineum TaxID=301880 RepID=A0ABQ5HMS3_9ASTR
MPSLKFTKTHNVVAFLEKSKESDGFAEIIDFLKASSVSYALTVNPIIYTSCIEQFSATAKVQTVNGVRQLQALVDKKRVIVTESSIRRDLHLDDAEGTDCLPTATIFKELACMGYEKPSQKLTFYKAFFSPQWKYYIHTITQCLSAKSIAWNEFSSSMASLIICLATNQKFNLSKYIFDAMVKHLDGGVKFLLVGKDFSGRITPLFDTMMVQPVAEMGEDSNHPTDSTPIHIIDQPSSSSQPKKDKSSKKAQRQEAEVLDLQKAKDAQAKEIDALKKRIQRLERRKMSRPTGLKRLSKVGMSRRVKSSEDQESLGVLEDASKQGRSIKDIDADVDSKKPNDSTDGEAVTTASIADSAVPTTNEEITLAQTLIQIKAAKPKVVTTAATTTTTTRPKDRGVIAVLMRHQSKEREELTDKEKAKLFMELMEKRRKHFATLRAQVKRNRPPTKAQKRTQMSTYLKHMGGYTYKQLKGKSFDEIQKLFDKEMKRVKYLCSKRRSWEGKEAGKEQPKESSKKQKVEEEKESEEVDEVELKLLVIKKDEDIAIDAIQLATKLPVIIDYKLHKEGMLVHYQLIRADGSSKRYSSMIKMLQGIDREGLEDIWRIVKAKYGDTRPENEFERVLYGDLKVMFEPDIKSDVWRILQGYMVTI